MTDESMKKELLKLERNRLLAQRREELAGIRAVANARERDKLVSERLVQDPRGGPLKTKWEIAKAEADKALSAEVTMYNDWRNAMMGLLSMYSALTDALIQTRKELFQYASHNLSGDGDGGKLSPMEQELPALFHKVNCNDKNELEFKNLALETSTGTKLDNTLDELFRKGVEHWLSECGYKSCGTNSSQFYNIQDNSILTKEKFNELKDDSNKGLDAFLSGHFDMSIRNSPAR